MPRTPPTPPAALAQKIMDMLRRRRPELEEALEELSRSREGLNAIAEAFNAAYETYLRTARVEEAYETFVSVLESSIGEDYDEG